MNFSLLFISLILVLLYSIFALFFKAGLKRKYKIRTNDDLFVSVIVAARNEADSIKQCLISLDKLNYPNQLLEIFIVNDRSEDKTPEIISEFIKGKPCFKYLQNENVKTNLSGKANAISLAIEKSHGEIIFITDADCEAPAGWIKNMISYFHDNVGLVAGFTLLYHSKNIFSMLQSLDWSFMLSVAAGSIGLGIPLSCIGNNFAIRRITYNEVGGYEGVGFSVTEDFALLQAIVKKTNWRVVFPFELQSIVISKPVKNIIEFFKQRKRWAVGGISVHWFGKLIIVLSICAHLEIVCLLVFGKFMTAGIMFGAILISDLLLLYSSMKKIKKLNLLFLLPIYKFLSLFYMLILSIILLLNRTTEWKGIKYPV